MIKQIIHKGLKKLYNTGSTAGIQVKHAAKLNRILGSLDVALNSDDMDLPSYDLHQLKGDKKEIWSVKVNGNYRVTFRFIGNDVELVNYEDYH